MRFTKKVLTIPEQIILLESRGMVISDKEKAAHYLSNISYYRLSAYWYIFLQGPKKDHIFKDGTRLEQAIRAYVFDRKLRLLVFNELERIEIALRTQIIHHFCLEFGNNWYEDPGLFKKETYCNEFQALIQKELKKSSEVFIKHYLTKYTEPKSPPAWMALELISFGQLSLLYKNLRNVDAKKSVADHFGIHENVLTSWLETLSFIRNTCAHHGRLWNRKLPKPPIIPVITKESWLSETPADEFRNRLYIVLASISYLLKGIVPNGSFNPKLSGLIKEFNDIPIHYMGFTTDWEKDPFWKS